MKCAHTYKISFLHIIIIYRILKVHIRIIGYIISFSSYAESRYLPPVSLNNIFIP